ncbi:hypothetical protein LIER_26534 [Lithospermum erythrorhizon]|uniref:Reverse transcriptase domain-containing protein n=1 Tax=Lithospermum erythrorhizon TaxID=34254 RepID=A0AAV3R9Z7_LITER
MPGIVPKLAVHKLNVDSTFHPVKQKKRLFNDEKKKGIIEVIQTLLKANAIRDLKFPNWIADFVLVNKPNNKWRMCTDFTSLKKVCPNDFYPLPCLRRLVDGREGHEVFNFMEAFQGYHLVRMLPEDEEKIAFITEYVLYCWKLMPFGLTNVAAHIHE